MKISDFIFEDVNVTVNDKQAIDNMRSFLQTNCKDIYQKFYKNSDVFLYHSPSYNLIEKMKKDFFVTIQNKKRNLDYEEIPPYFHQFMDDYLKSQHGIDFRTNALFTVAKEFRSGEFNAIVFPKDGFETLYSSKVHDPFFNIKNCLTSKDNQEQFMKFLYS